MGNVACATSDSECCRRNREIDRLLAKERRETESEIKLLLLGTGGSGKSTVAKQMKIIHVAGFTEQEKADFRNVVFQNIINAIQTLARESQRTDPSLGVLPPESQAAQDLIMSIIATSHIIYDEQVAKAVHSLWQEPLIVDTFARSHEFQLNDSASYFLCHCLKFCDASYTPSDEDILHARIKTTGIVEISFFLEKQRFLMVDVGGQRNERKKWIHCFQDVTAVLFCVAMNEYDMLMEADNSTNRLQDSLQVFKDIAESPYLNKTPIIIFLNKKDLFAKKACSVNLDCCFPLYSGGLDYDNAAGYIWNKFVSVGSDREEPIIAHFTRATDTKNIRIVFESVRDLLMKKSLQLSGMN
jgi:GTPase SAR1 family protein